ncbi:MAG: SUMF1/EgtB/PvdO family nonheme iron enzyme [Nitrospirales bacterium]|nr:SUMF1/EgtB/PvdO family nonheme iron enzyme [Nitrospirales bacterium]
MGRRVVRGGSWNNNQNNAGASYRNNNHPDNRNNNIGFRVVRSSHILCPLLWRGIARPFAVMLARVHSPDDAV